MHDRINIYDPRYIKTLFEEMSATYGIMNLCSSFGFTAIWRRFCVAQLPEQPLSRCCDLLSGMGELLPILSRRYPEIQEITALDICPAMCRKIEEHQGRISAELSILEEDVFESSLQESSFDAVFSSFGLKTFNSSQQRDLARLVKRIVKPSGVFSFIELSLPRTVFLRLPLLIYLRYVVPQIGRLFLGNPENYRMLGVYTEAFQDSRHFYSCLRDEGLEVKYVSHFFGCATGVVGRRPI